LRLWATDAISIPAGAEAASLTSKALADLYRQTRYER
jgi:hypothetical protein